MSTRRENCNVSGSAAAVAQACEPVWRENGMPFFLEPVFTGRRRVINIVGILFWILCLAYFWLWWFQPGHVHTAGRYVLVTLVLLWITLVPVYYMLLFSKARVPHAHAAPTWAPRVALVVTKAPSEPLEVVAATLRGALRQNHVDHDTWLADEDPTPAMIEWCQVHGVGICSRHGNAAYHRDRWPRRTRCKEGNLAYFYDTIGYENYDLVAQFDADHVPDPDYLKHAIAPFADPAVGYVSAPSICDSNARESWSARGRLYVEASMHGSLQAGYNAGWAPLCIGSHYTVRTAALREIGGLGPELAEDHSTSLMFNAGGWRGVHAVDALAHGAGPVTFADLIVQEFQWSRSLVTILFRYSPIHVRRLTAGKRFQFLFSQLWYPCFSCIMALTVALPIMALVSGEHFVNVTYVDYFLHILPLSVTLLLLAYWWRATGLFRPADASVVSWEGLAFLFLRWPWALMGSVVAVVDWLRDRPVLFRVTPKGGRGSEPLPYRVIAPYVLISLASSGVAWLVQRPGSAAGFYIFGLVNAIIYAGLVALILYRHVMENDLPLLPGSTAELLSILSLAVMIVAIAGAARANGARGLAAVNLGFEAITLTETSFTPSGAGRQASVVVRFKPQWRGF